MNHKTTFALGIFCGLLGAFTLSGPSSHAQPAKDQPVVTVDESKMTTHYANAYRIHTTTEELIVDFGFNMPNPAKTATPGELLFQVNNRVILNFYNSKRLSTSLSKTVKQIEAELGEIQIPDAEGR